MSKFIQTFHDAKVYYRITSRAEINSNDVQLQNDDIYINCNKKNLQGNSIPLYRKYQTDGIFFNTSQEQIYEKTTSNIVDRVMKGQNALVVAFGQTGSGKSLTLGGFEHFFNDRGIVPRLLEDLFKIHQENDDVSYHLSYMEILSRNKAHDLLQPYPCVIDKNNLKDLTKIPVLDVMQALNLVFAAEGRKELNQKVNYSSHLGSSILTVRVALENHQMSTSHQKVSYIHVVDFAGIDIVGKTDSTKQKHKKYIGLANLDMGNFNYFMKLLMENEMDLLRLKERASIMSQYLKNYLNTESLLRFIGHLKLDGNNLLITHSLLQFGQKIKGLKPKVTPLVLENEQRMRENLAQKLSRCEKEQLMSKMLENYQFSDTAQDLLKIFEKNVDDFLGDKIDDMTLLNVVNLNDLINILKSRIIAGESDKKINSKVLEKTKKDMSENKMKISPPMDKIVDSESVSNFSQRTGKKVTKIESKESLFKADGKSDTKFSKKNKISTSSLHKKTAPAKKNVGDFVTSDKKESKLTGSLLSAANLLLPDLFLEYKDALKDYITSDNTVFNNAIEIFRSYDDEAKEIHKEYVEAVKKLNEIADVLELRKMELLRAKMLKDFQKPDQADFDTIKAKLQSKCVENYETVKEKLIKQQESVLNLQSNLKLTLDLKQNIKNQVRKEFDEYCKENYNILIPNLSDVSEKFDENEINIESYFDDVDIKDDEDFDKMYVKKYQSLKKVMLREIKRKQAYLRQQICWT